MSYAQAEALVKAAGGGIRAGLRRGVIEKVFGARFRSACWAFFGLDWRGREPGSDQSIEQRELEAARNNDGLCSAF
jgi:hypothetical protein